MIEVTNLQKSFENIKAIDQITARIEEGHVFGLIGTNGAGKSTFLRLICGVLKADSGQVLVDGDAVYNNPAVKAKFFYISDEMFFFKNGTPRDMGSCTRPITLALTRGVMRNCWGSSGWTQGARSIPFPRA